MSLEALAAKEWMRIRVPGPRPPGTMLTEAERKLLYFLADRYFTDAGHIIDAGCFVGGSTSALGLGLRAWRERAGRAPAHRIHAYDLFRAAEWMYEKHLPRTVAAGASLLPEFERITAPVRDLIDVHEGDITALPRPAGPIEILFVDVAKTPDLSDYVVREFFPALIPGRSIVVQQDYLYDFDSAAWLHVTMEHYADYFRIVTDTGVNSVVFLYEKAIPPHLLSQRTIAGIAASDKIRLMARARARFAGDQANLLGRAHWRYLTGRNFTGDDVEAHRAAAEAAKYLVRPVDDSDGAVRAATARLEESERRRAILERRIEAMETSTSWRLTAGLRATGYALSGLRLKHSKRVRPS